MRYLFVALLVVICANDTLAQTNGTAKQYGQAFSGGSYVSGGVLVLFGNQNEQGFLDALSVAPHKGTFICDNIDSQATTSFVTGISADGKYDFEVTSGTWPVNETIAICGTARIKQLYEGDWVDTDFKFAAWGSASGYADLTTQVPSLKTVYVDYCPQHETKCENVATHPEPPMPWHKATVAGKLSAHDCAGQAAVIYDSVQFVLNATPERKNFNDSSSPNRCGALPKYFGDGLAETSGHFGIDADGDVSYSIDVPFQGGSASGAIYICAEVKRSEGSDSGNCTSDSGNGNKTFIWKKQSITLYPGSNVEIDANYDFTRLTGTAHSYDDPTP